MSSPPSSEMAPAEIRDFGTSRTDCTLDELLESNKELHQGFQTLTHLVKVALNHALVEAKLAEISLKL